MSTQDVVRWYQGGYTKIWCVSGWCTVLEKMEKENLEGIWLTWVCLEHGCYTNVCACLCKHMYWWHWQELCLCKGYIIVRACEHWSGGEYVLTDKEVSPSLVRHCGTRCRSLFVTHLWQWRSSAHIWRLFYFAQHIILSIAPSWQFRL